MKYIKNIIKSITYTIITAYVSFGMATSAAMAGYENVSLRYDVTAAKKINLQYDIYAGGFQAMNATLELDLDKKAYDMALTAQTDGFIGHLFPWKGVYSTSGHTEKGTLIPSLHMASSAWRNKTSVTEMSYDPSGRLLKATFQDGPKTEIKRDLDESLTADTVDMLTGTLLMMQSTRTTHQCKGSFPVFDGKRRFNVTLQEGGREILPKSRYSKFSGEALRCTLKVEPVAGFKKKDMHRGWMAVQEHTEERRKPPTLWMAQVEKNGPVVPVRMEIASAYGSVVAHLVDKTAQ